VCIIKEAFLRAAAKAYPRAAEALESWVAVVKDATWPTPVEMKQAFRSVGPVVVKSKRTVYVFNIRRNEFRLIVAVHFDRQIVYTLRFISHAEDDRQNWKQEL
jgi:mRNA interferase HigB